MLFISISFCVYFIYYYYQIWHRRISHFLVILNYVFCKNLFHHPISFHHFIQPLTLYSEEHFIAFHLDSKYQVIGYHEVSKGTLNASLVHPREVFKAALLSNAYAIIVAHNHPSGSVLASPEDIDITKQLIKAGKIMGVCIVDHCIVSSEGLNSLRETESHLWGE